MKTGEKVKNSESTVDTAQSKADKKAAKLARVKPRKVRNIVGSYKLWWTISGVILLAALGGVFFRGLNLGVEFKGGAEFGVSAANCTVSQVRQNVSGAGVNGAVVTELGSSRIRVQTPPMSTSEAAKLASSLATTCKVKADDVKVQVVGPTWGGEITGKAVTALIVFLIAVSIFLTIYFEWRMAVAALVALVHDLLITLGIYALVGFEVTPATVIGLLTILGFSLYDTVVVFDKVKENTKGIFGQSRMTYSQAANLALNQTFMRSLNTSVVAMLPVAAILFVGAGFLGAGTLKDLALALFVGTAAGTYSSLFVATPLLCQLEERRGAAKTLREKVRRNLTSTPKTSKTKNVSDTTNVAETDPEGNTTVDEQVGKVETVATSVAVGDTAAKPAKTAEVRPAPKSAVKPAPKPGVRAGQGRKKQSRAKRKRKGGRH